MAAWDYCEAIIDWKNGDVYLNRTSDPPQDRSKVERRKLTLITTVKSQLGETPGAFPIPVVTDLLKQIDEEGWELVAIFTDTLGQSAEDLRQRHTNLE